MLADDFDYIKETASKLGLTLNTNKCEIISKNGFSNLPLQFHDFVKVDPDNSELLGAPLFKGSHLSGVLACKLDDLVRAAKRLENLTSHDSLLILRFSLSAPKLMYISHTSPCTDHPLLVSLILLCGLP